MTSLLVTPLDVVRIRLQSQQPAPPAAPLPTGVQPRLGYSTLGGNGNSAVTSCCREVFFSRGWSVNGTTVQCDYIPYESAAIEGGVCAVEETTKRSFQGTWEGLRKIARYEGFTSLWRGLSPTLYFPTSTSKSDIFVGQWQSQRMSFTLLDTILSALPSLQQSLKLSLPSSQECQPALSPSQQSPPSNSSAPVSKPTTPTPTTPPSAPSWRA